MTSIYDGPESESMNKLSVEELDIVKGDVELSLGVLLRSLNWKRPCIREMLMGVLLS